MFTNQTPNPSPKMNVGETVKIRAFYSQNHPKSTGNDDAETIEGTLTAINGLIYTIRQVLADGRIRIDEVQLVANQFRIVSTQIQNALPWYRRVWQSLRDTFAAFRR